MSMLTLTKNLNVGEDPDDSDTISIGCSFVYGTEYFPKRLNQYKLPTADGGEVVYDCGPTKIFLTLLLKNVSYADGKLLETYVRDIVLFSVRTFDIAGVPKLDLGQGEGVGCTYVRYPENSLEGVFSLTAPKGFNVNLPLTYLRK